MDARQYLLQIERLDRKIQSKLDEIYRLKTLTTSITIAPKDVNVQTSSDMDRTGTTVARIVDLEREADELTDKFYDLKCDIKGKLEQMDKEEFSNILFERYFNYKSIYQIAQETKCDYRKLKRKHNQALYEFSKILDIAVREK